MGNFGTKETNNYTLTYQELYPDNMGFFTCKDINRFKTTDVVGISYIYSVKSVITSRTLLSCSEGSIDSKSGYSCFCNEKKRIKKIIDTVRALPDNSQICENKQRILHILDALNKIEIEEVEI